MTRDVEHSFAFRKDGRLVVWLDGLLLALSLAGSLLILAGDAVGLSVGVALLALGLLVVWVVFPAHYRLTDQALVVKTGPFERSIPLAAIRRVEPARSRPCATAWSFDSLRITYVDGERELMMLVAPRDREAFLEKLASAVPGLELSNNRARSGPVD